MLDAIHETLQHYAAGPDGERARALLADLLSTKSKDWVGSGWRMCIHAHDNGPYDLLDNTRVLVTNETGSFGPAWVRMDEDADLDDGLGILVEGCCGYPTGTRIHYVNGNEHRWPEFGAVIEAVPR